MLGVDPASLPLQIHTAEDAHGRPIEDIRDGHDDDDFANEVFERVAELAEPEERLDLIGVMAGGRKNMSGHLQNAFSVWARPGDLLFHVVVSPPEIERTAFFYKRASDPAHARVEIRPIPVTFPRLNPLLRAPILDAIHPDARTQRQILDQLQDYLDASRATIG